MTEKGQPLPYPLDECAGCRDLTQQLAQADDLSGTCRICRYTGHAAKMAFYNGMNDMREQRTALERQVATVTSALDVLCEAIERGEHDDDYLRRRAAEWRMALAQGRGA